MKLNRKKFNETINPPNNFFISIFNQQDLRKNQTKLNFQLQNQINDK
jgi:hypothetical protein